MELEFSVMIFEKTSNIKFHDNPSCGSELLHANGRTYMTKLIDGSMRSTLSRNVW